MKNELPKDSIDVFFDFNKSEEQWNKDLNKLFDGSFVLTKKVFDFWLDKKINDSGLSWDENHVLQKQVREFLLCLSKKISEEASERNLVSKEDFYQVDFSAKKRTVAVNLKEKKYMKI